MNHVTSDRAHPRRIRLLILGLLVVAALVALLVTIAPLRMPQLSRSQPADPPTVPTVEVTPSSYAQPSRQGYRFHVMEERYDSRQADGSLKTTHRRRESWTAPDGWSWAQQTGVDPAFFVFSANPEWPLFRRVKPNATEINQVLRDLIGSSSTGSDYSQSAFNLVSDLLSVASMPISAFPIEYRQAMIDALELNPEIVRVPNTTDPLDRPAPVKVTFTTAEVMLALYLDQEFQFLAHTGETTDGQRAFKTITDQKYIDRIPDDLLVKVGPDRKARQSGYRNQTCPDHI